VLRGASGRYGEVGGAQIVVTGVDGVGRLGGVMQNSKSTLAWHCTCIYASGKFRGATAEGFSKISYKNKN